MYPRIFERFSTATLLPKVEATRRGFLLGAVASGAGLAVGFRLTGNAMAATAPEAYPFQPYISIAPDNRVTILSSQFDMGQAAWFGIATLVNEELDADWASINVEGGSGNTAAYGNLAMGGAVQMTGGSTSMASSWQRYRAAGAALRLLLIAAAARAWSVPAAEVGAAKGRLSHPSGKDASYGEMAAQADGLTLPAEIPLKAASQWTQIGNAGLRRFDSAMKTNGTAEFTIDVRLPGMATAVMIHPPKFGATVASFDAAKAKAMAGVIDVVQIPRGVAVVAENMWTAIRARKEVSVTWNDDKAEMRGTDEILAAYTAQAKAAPLAIARTEGDVEKAMAGAKTVIEATYTFPYLAHAAIEPLNAVARMQDGVLEVWGGHQAPDIYIYTASQISGLSPEKVKLHVRRAGGSFGRRAVFDADVVSEAIEVAKALNWARPVKVQWTRDNDMKGGRYRPAYVHAMKAGIDEAGNIVAWSHHIVGQSILGGTAFESFGVQKGVDITSVEGASTLPYAIPNLSVGLSTMSAGVPILWWRSVGSSHNGYATEAFLDEVAKAAGKDPVALRLGLLADHPRHMAALKLAAEKAGWDKPAAKDRFRGVAVVESFGSVVAEIAEISLPSPGEIKVEKVVCAVDCGIAVNPDQVAAQVEGGVGFGLGAILAEEITMTSGVVDQENYDSYTPLRIDAMPAVEVHIVPSEASPSGIGEPGVPPIGPAVANAVLQATGKPVRKLPFSRGFQA